MTSRPAPCQEMIYRAEDPDFDLRKLVPAPTNTPEDAGPYVTMGLCSGSDPETGDTDVTIHRLCIQSRDEMTMWITPGSRHLGAFWEKYLKLNKPMPISVSIGLDPSNDPAFSPSIRVHGISCKAIFDCTVPFSLKDKFERCKFMEVNPKKWLPDFDFTV